MKSAEEFLAQLAAESGDQADAYSTQVESVGPQPDRGGKLASSSGNSPTVEALLADLPDELKDVALPEHSREELSKQIEARAVALLAMREHGAKELKSKLVSKFPETPELLERYRETPGLVTELVDEVLQRCQENNWQSDERYIEQAVRSLAAKGQGPMKIRQKLQQGCRDHSLIDAYLDWDEADWVELAREVLEKKYGDCAKPATPKEQAKRQRFLHGRGFTSGTIWKAFR